MLKVTAHPKKYRISNESPSITTSPPSPAETLKMMRQAQKDHLDKRKRQPAVLPTTANPESERPATLTERKAFVKITAIQEAEAKGVPPPAWAVNTRPKPTQNTGKSTRNNQDVRTTFPRPTTKFGTGPKAFKYLINYWKALSEEHLDRIVVYVYRKWPVIDRMLAGHKNSSIAVFAKTDEPNSSGKCPFLSNEPIQDLLHMFGSGEYKFMLNERGVPNSVLAMEIIAVDDQYPPQLDYNELVQGHKLNNAYIDGLRRRGIKLPWDDPNKKEKEEEEEMNNNAVAGQLAGTISDLANRISAGNTNQPPSVEQQAVASGMSIVQQASTMGMEIIKAGIDSNTSKTDPIAMLEAITRLTGTKDDGVQIELMRQNAELQSRVTAIQQDSAKELRLMMKDMMEMQMKTFEAREDIPPPKSELEVLKEAVEKKELLDKLNGNGTPRRRNNEDEEKEKESTIDLIMKNAPAIIGGLATIAQMGANVYHNYTALRMNPSAQTQPQTAPPGPDLNSQPLTHPNPQQGQQGQQGPPQTQMQPIQPAQQENQGDPEVLELMRAKEMLTAMQPALLAHYFGDGTDGVSFAHWIITQGLGANPTQIGRKTYDGMKEAGKEKLLFVLKNHPIWNDIGGTPQKTEIFLNMFFDYDRIMEQRSNEDEGEEGEEEPGNGKIE